MKELIRSYKRKISAIKEMLKTMDPHEFMELSERFSTRLNCYEQIVTELEFLQEKYQDEDM